MFCLMNNYLIKSKCSKLQVRWIFPPRKQTELIWIQSSIDAEVGFSSQEANRTNLISKYYRRCAELKNSNLPRIWPTKLGRWQKVVEKRVVSSRLLRLLYIHFSVAPWLCNFGHPCLWQRTFPLLYGICLFCLGLLHFCHSYNQVDH